MEKRDLLWVIPLRRSRKITQDHRPIAPSPARYVRSVLQQAQEHATRQQGSRKLPALHRRHVNPLLTSPFLKMSKLIPGRFPKDQGPVFYKLDWPVFSLFIFRYLPTND